MAKKTPAVVKTPDAEAEALGDPSVDKDIAVAATPEEALRLTRPGQRSVKVAPEAVPSPAAPYNPYAGKKRHLGREYAPGTVRSIGRGLKIVDA